MAKKKFNISSTLNKNKPAPTPLADKVPLTKSAKDPLMVKEKVEQLHATPSPVKKPKPAPAPPKKVAKAPKKEEKVKLVRMTIDTPDHMHKRLKIKSVEMGVSIRDYILRLIEKDLK